MTTTGVGTAAEPRTDVAAAPRLRILLVEDDPDDALLVTRALRGEVDADITRVETAGAYMDELGAHPDLIIADLSLPRFSGSEALALRGRWAPEIPFLVVSGAFGDGVAAGLIAAGATDYLMKDRLGRLGPAVRRAIEERGLRAAEDATRTAAREAQRLAQVLVERSADPVLLVDAGGVVTTANPAAAQLFGDNTGAGSLSLIAEKVHPDDMDAVVAAMGRIFAEPGVHQAVNLRAAAPDGGWRHLSLVANNQLADPAVRGIVVNVRDVTAEVELLGRVERGQAALVAALDRAAEARDPYTAGHQRSVEAWAVRIAAELGLDADAIREIGLGAGVHDIGKLAVPAEILTRPGKLGPAEMELVRTHCRVGYEILRGSGMPGAVTDIVLHHHERLDGSGYPDGLTGGQISLATAIVAVADVFDAMSAHRPYRPALGEAAALDELRRNSGVRYRADVVDAMLKVVAAQAERPGGHGSVTGGWGLTFSGEGRRGR